MPAAALGKKMLSRLIGILVLLAVGGYFAAAGRYPQLRPKWDSSTVGPTFSAQSCMMMAAICVVWSVLVATAGWLLPTNFAKVTFGATLFLAAGFYYSDFRRPEK